MKRARLLELLGLKPSPGSQPPSTPKKVVGFFAFAALGILAGVAIAYLF